VIGALALAGTGESGAPITIRHLGLSTLRELGYGDEVRHATRADYQRPRIFFALPASAAQGPHLWYLVRLHLRLVLAPDSGAGKIDVSATTNGAACALIEFRVAGPSKVAWTSVGIVDGARSGASSSGTVELRYANYLQNSGVRPGQNELDFQIGQHGAARVAEVRFFDDSGIELSRLGPANVRLTARRASSGPVRVGRRFAVDFALRNPGGRAASGIRVSADYPAKLLSLATRQPVRVGLLRGGASATGQLVFVAKRAGKAPIFVSAQTSSNHPGDLVTVTIRP
jgi:hypothetical protein